MTKEQAKRVKIGTQIRSVVTGIERGYPVEEIVLTGHRPPYFRINGILITYHNVAFGKHKNK